MDLKTTKNLQKNGIIKIGSNIQYNDIIIGKIKRQKESNFSHRLLSAIFNRAIIKDSSIKATKSMSGTIIKTKILKKKTIYSITIYFSQKRKIQLGDKIAGRHGNKGIVSKILPNEEMPYLQDGTPLDILLNPLGIPSRMNVGQILECLLGLSGNILKENYQISSFQDKYRDNISKCIVYNKLYESKKKTGKTWLFNPNFPGKTKLFDGRNGKTFEQPIAIGYSYILKLMHLVEDKINARLTGPYSLILKQPIRGKARNGGQRFGEMEVWAIEGFGAAYTLQELLTIKSDDLTNRSKTIFSLIKGTRIPKPGIPESFKTLILELQCLCLDIEIHSERVDKFF